MATRKLGTTRSEINKIKIINAAIACFKKSGAARTSMEDIAEEAGLARKTVYRTFSNRTVLLDTVAMQRVSDAVDQVKPVVDACTSLDEAIIKGTIHSLRVMRSDIIFMSVVKDANDRGVEEYLIAPSSPVRKAMLGVWKEAFTKARARGELRTDLTDEQITDWMRGVHLLFLLRTKLSAKSQETLLRAFVLPALYCQK